LLLYSSKPSLGVHQLAGLFTSSTNAVKFSGTIITEPSSTMIHPLYLWVINHYALHQPARQLAKEKSEIRKRRESVSVADGA
jgi:hypothetical protein